MNHEKLQLNNNLGESELIINNDGSIFHLCLLPEDIADTIILVGDPNRVSKISCHFDTIEVQKSNREFVAHTGNMSGKRLTVLATGMGSENIDIVINELDALVNIDFQSRTRHERKKKLNLIRLGTCGGLQDSMPLDSILVTNIAFGLSSLMCFYHYKNSEVESSALNEFQQHYPGLFQHAKPFIAEGDNRLIQHFSSIGSLCHTVTCPGFYGPQGRELNGTAYLSDFFEKMASFQFNQLHISNFEMETAAIYALAKMLGHRCCSISTMIAQRATRQFSNDPNAAVENMIYLALERIANLDQLP